MIELILELRISKCNAAAELRLFKSKRADSSFEGIRRERGVSGSNSLLNSVRVCCEVSGWTKNGRMGVRKREERL
jgi:hypothetical protein